MKFLVVVLLTVLAVSAEPPRYRQRPRFQKQELAPPYPASGWRPSGAEFRLPPRQVIPLRQELPRQTYGPPSPTYGPPSPSYGPPTEEPATEEPTTTEEVIVSTTELPEQEPPAQKLINKEAEEVEVNEAKKNEQPQVQGVYYLLLPGGQLSKVQYVTTGDVSDSAYTAQLQYQEVQPIRGPIYGFNENGQLVQLL